MRHIGVGIRMWPEKDGLTSSLSTEISDSVTLVLADALEKCKTMA